MTGKKWFENGSRLSGLEIHQDGGGRARRVRSAVLECGVCGSGIWVGV